MTTHYHSQYWAHALTLKSASDSFDNLSRSISNTRQQAVLNDDYEGLDEIEDEWEEELVEEPEIDPELIGEELAALRAYAELAEGIQHNAEIQTAFDRLQAELEE